MARPADRLLRLLPRSLRDKVPRDHRESDAAFRRRRVVTAATTVTGATLLGASFRTEPDSRPFYALTGATAATWVAGSFASGRLHLGWEQDEAGELERPVATPAALGLGAFGAFYAAALVCRRIPPLERALRNVLQFADQGSTPRVVATTLVNGAAEEVFFRGAAFAAAGTTRPVLRSTALYAGVTAATRNPALVLAGGVMGTLFALQRRASGGIQAPMITHLTWSSLMLRFMPPLFRERDEKPVEGE